MNQRVLLLLSVCTLLAGAFAGCFGDDQASAQTNGTPGSELRPFETTLYLHQQMFHPHPAGMLTAWAFSEDPNPPTGMEFEPPVLRVKEGQRVKITFVNTDQNGFNHTIHWHGVHVPFEMDGVPYVTQDPVQPGESFTYDFVAKPSGTHFFHCHVDTPHHMDMGMYGVLIVEPNTVEKKPFDREQTLIFDDWDSSHLHQSDNADVDMTRDSATDPSGDPINQIDRTGNQARDVYNNPPQYPVVKDVYENPAREKRDWYPETFAPWQPVYDTWTINGKSYPYTVSSEDTLLTIDEGERLKLRLVNVGNTIFAIHLHGHHFLVTHADGYELDSPYWKDTLLIGPGERYDIWIEGNNPGVWMFHDHNGLHEMNNHISPGGIMTHLVYDGFMEDMEGGGHDHGSHAVRSTDFFGLYR